MATPSAQQRLFEELLERFGPQIAGAFRAAIDDLRSNAEVQRVIAALELGDIERAIQALHIDGAAFGQLQDALQQAYAAGGQAGIEAMPSRGPDGTALVIRFSARNPRAEAWLRGHSSTLVTEIVEDQRQAVRQHLTTRMAEGANPRTTALDIVGRVSRVTGKREAGLIGLTEQQAGWVRSYEADLAGVPTAKSLDKTLRDRRFDRTVRKAIAAGEPVPAETRQKMVAAYRNRALRLRGETIGRVEAMSALQNAKRESFRQAVESGKIAEDEIERTWRSARDLRVRDTHAILDGQKERGLSRPFVSASGARMLHPMDTSLGAGASEIVGCRCDCEYRIRWLARIGSGAG
jgi:hypothetical protein